jgi:hypothetical protein
MRRQRYWFPQVKIALCQISVSPDKAANLEVARSAIRVRQPEDTSVDNTYFSSRFVVVISFTAALILIWDADPHTHQNWYRFSSYLMVARALSEKLVGEGGAP